VADGVTLFLLLYTAADNALYDAERAGGDRVTVAAL
jgi:hypothetical protein